MNHWPDLINGLFEGLAGLMVLNHCRVLYADKSSRGVSIVSSFFFTIWGLWNLYYYPTLNQPLSFFGGMFVVAANIVYVSMMAFYRRNKLDFSSQNFALQENSKARENG